MSTPNRQLSTYLNDHLGLATAGTKLAHRLAERDDVYGKALHGVAEEIGQDREDLKSVMQRLGVRRNGAKAAAAFVGEYASRIKLGSHARRPQLNRLEELETLSVGIEGKKSMWRALRATLDNDSRVSPSELDELIGRAKTQRKRVERLRLRAAAESLPQRARVARRRG